jgi:putative DNA primase/helicase
MDALDEIVRAGLMDNATIDCWPRDAVDRVKDGWRVTFEALRRLRANGGVTRVALAAELEKAGLYSDATALGELNLDGEPPTIASVQRAWRSIPRRQVPVREVPAAITGGPLSDAGNGERFATRHGQTVRYVHGWGRWLIWDSARWAVDDRGEVRSLMVETARQLLRGSEGAEPEVRQRIGRYALASESRERIMAALDLASSMAPIAVTPDELDRDPDLLNLPNGTMDLRTGRLRPQSPADLITKIAPVPYEPDAEAPTWVRVLARIIPDAEVRSYLQRASGYSLTGNVSEHCLFFAYGAGRNGKTTVLEILRQIAGEFSHTAGPELLLSAKNDRHPVEIAVLRGVRYATTVEVAEGRWWDESRVKWVTGGDMLQGRVMHGNPFDFTPSHKLWVAGNHRPRAHGTDLGFWRRVHLIPFSVTIPESEQDPELPAKLRAELPGILRWAVEGAVSWRKEGLRPPAAILAATTAYRAGEDVLGLFLEERCVIRPDSRVLVGSLFDEYRLWAERSGEHAVSKKAFGDSLEERGIERVRSNGKRWFQGISLRLIQGGLDAEQPEGVAA